MHFDPRNPPPAVVSFFTERHLSTISIATPSGVPHLTPVGFTYDPSTGTARVITWAGSRKARLISKNPDQPVAVCQVDGGRWLTLTGTARLHTDGPEIAEGVQRYATRYRQPKDRDDRVVITIDVQDMLGRVPDEVKK